MSETIDERDFDLAYQAIARDPRYAHFINIPGRIVRCLDHFGIACNRIGVRQRLHEYYLFIGVVDDAIDSGKLDIGKDIIERFSDRVPCFNDRTRGSRVSLVTEVLKQDISDEVHPLVVGKLHELYRAVMSERKAETISAYIEQRKVVGRLTAELSYVLIRSFLEGEHRNFRRFLKRVGAVGCLVDSVIDLRADTRLGLLGFKPGMMDYVKLIICTLRDGLRVSLKHPGLAGLFLQAIGDNVQDRFRAGRSFTQPSFVSDRKAEPASVA